jgi:hypothetical protein
MVGHTVYHCSNYLFKKFNMDLASKHQIWGSYFSKPGASEWGNRKYKYTISLSSDIKLASPFIKRHIYLEEMGATKDYGKTTMRRLKSMGYDGADLGSNEIVIWSPRKIKIVKVEKRY